MRNEEVKTVKPKSSSIFLLISKYNVESDIDIFVSLSSLTSKYFFLSLFNYITIKYFYFRFDLIIFPLAVLGI